MAPRRFLYLLYVLYLLYLLYLLFHTGNVVSISQLAVLAGNRAAQLANSYPYADVCERMLTYADVC